ENRRTARQAGDRQSYGGAQGWHQRSQKTYLGAAGVHSLARHLHREPDQAGHPRTALVHDTVRVGAVPARRPPSQRLYGAAQWNESPQAQLPPAFGFSIVKPCFSMLSTKSIEAPSTSGDVIRAADT